MGYSIRIGGAEPDFLTANEMLAEPDVAADPRQRVRWEVPAPFPGWVAVAMDAHGLLPNWATVGPIKHGDAPAPPEDPFPHENLRMPSYIGWGNFMDRAGLIGTFEDKETGLFREHPGTVVLTREHLGVFMASLDLYPINHRAEGVGDPEIEAIDRERLEWLVWWTRYALEHCKCPAIHNS